MKIEIEKDFRPSKIVCIGRNYAEHAAELGNDVPKEPLYFAGATGVAGSVNGVVPAFSRYESSFETSPS